MQTAQEYTDFYSSAPTLVKPLVDDFTDRLADSDVGEVATSTEENKRFKVPECAILPANKPLKGNFKLLQMWEGRVVSIDEDEHEFTAIVNDKTNSLLPGEELTMSIEEIPPSDLSLLASGAVFYWSIGYSDYPGRPRTRESRIRFRRLKKWQKSEINIAKDRGKKLADFFAAY